VETRDDCADPPSLLREPLAAADEDQVPPQSSAPPPGRQQQPPEFVTVEEASALLRVNSKTLREAIRRNSVPGVIKLGRAVRIHWPALVEWCRGSAVLRSGVKQ